MYPEWINFIPAFGAVLLLVVGVVIHEVFHAIAGYLSKRVHYNAPVTASLNSI